MTIGTTASARRLLQIICTYQADHHGVSPSFEEMRESLQCRSKSGVHRILAQLEERGHIRRLSHRQRAIEVLAPPPALPRVPTRDMRDPCRFVHLVWDDGEKRLIPLVPSRNPA